MADGKEDKKTKKLRFSWMDKNDSVENETNSTHSKTEETDHIDITGGTGGTGGAGPSAKVTTTGTPDGVRDKRNTSTSLENTFQRMKATQLKILQGATGGVGMHGDLSPEKLMELYDRQIAEMDLE